MPANPPSRFRPLLALVVVLASWMVLSFVEAAKGKAATADTSPTGCRRGRKCTRS